MKTFVVELPKGPFEVVADSFRLDPCWVVFVKNGTDGVAAFPYGDVRRISEKAPEPKPVNAEPLKLGPYAGKLVFIEADFRDERGNPVTYENGEYLCTHSTQNNLYCVKLGGVYDLHNLRTFPIIGSRPYKVISAHEDREFVRSAITRVSDELQKAKAPSYKKQWIETVYESAERNVNQIIRLLGL